MGLLSRLFGRRPPQQRPSAARSEVAPSKRKSASTPEPVELLLDSIGYVPLPRSPDAWEVREDDYGEFSLMDEPETAEVLHAYWEKKYNKVVGLVENFTVDRRVGHLGRVFAKAYRHIIRKWESREKPHVAAKWSAELLAALPEEATNRDRRKLNKLIRECEKQGKKCPYLPVELQPEEKDPLFAVSSDSSWELGPERKLPLDERPDPAFRFLHITRDGCVLVDESGRSDRYPDAEALLQKRDTSGAIVAERPLEHDIDVRASNPTSDRFAYMSRGGLLAAVDSELNETARIELGQRSEVRRRACEWWDPTSYCSHIDSVDVSPDGERLLFTLDDEAWCLDASGRILWGVKMPLPEGWRRVVDTSETTGTSGELAEALFLMGIALPISPSEIKERYKELALKWHPDVNRDDPTSHERMVQLNHAYEVLTGTSPKELEFGQSGGVYYERVEDSHTIEADGLALTFTVSMGTDRMGDWLHASSFGSSSGVSYVGSEKGKVVELSPTGQPRRVYDVGNMPERIVDTGSALFIQTRTRLYVLRGETLQTVVDIYREGDLIIGQTGFGLVSEKSFRWFDAAGALVGEVTTRHPIRLIHPIPGGILVSTRQHEAEVHGPPAWWVCPAKERSESAT